MEAATEILISYNLKESSMFLQDKYDENRRCYYTDGHEREDVVKDRNKRFLVEYFKLERRAHHWV
jgi:hypothetical protein